MMNKDKPITENAYQKSKRIKADYLNILTPEGAAEQVLYYWEKERDWSLQIIDILYRDVWQDLLPGIKTMLFYQTQSYLKIHYDNIKVPEGLCLDVYGRLSEIQDWKPASNDTLPKDYKLKNEFCTCSQSQVSFINEKYICCICNKPMAAQH